MNSIEHFLYAVVMVLIYDFMSGSHSAFALVAIISLYLTYLAVRFYLVRKQVIDRFSATTRPTQYFLNMDWATRKKWLGALVTLGAWKMLVILAKKWKTLPTTQAAGPITLQPDEKPYQKETEFWDTHAAERKYQFGDAGTTHTAKTTTPEQTDNIIGKRLKIVVKPDGEQCNALPIKGNVVLIPNHFVPKETLYVSVRNIGGSSYENLPLARSMCMRIPGTDLCVWYCPGIGDQKDITSYYPKEILDGKRVSAYTLYNNSGSLVKYPEMLARRERIITTEGGMFPGYKYTFPVDTFGGLCMATLIGTAQGTSFIAGHHLAGRGLVGAAGFVTRPQLLEAIRKLDELPGVLVSHSATTLNPEIMGIEFGPLTAPHDKCPTNVALNATSKIRIHGSHTMPGTSNPKSAVVTSLISEAVAQVMNIPKQHGPPQEMGAARHLIKDMSGKVDTATKFDSELVSKTYTDMETQLQKIPTTEIAKLGKLSDDVNLAGLDGVVGVNAMNFSTSQGFPFKGPKSMVAKKSDRVVEGISCPRDVDQKILDEVSRMEEVLLQGQSINTIFKGARKDEPTKLGADKVRVFAAANMPMTILVRKYFLTLAALFQRNKTTTECAVGVVVQSPEWTELYNHIGKHGWDRGIAGDYAKFDGRMSPQFMLMAFKLLIGLAEKSGNYEPDDLMIMRGIATEITYPTYDYFGTLVQFMGSNPSGHPLTVIINSLVNSLYMRYTYYAIARDNKWWRTPTFNNVVSLMTYGDDNIMTVAAGYEAFNHTAIAAELAKVQITYTMAEKTAESVPFIPLGDASFLKHFAVYDEDLGLYRSPIEEGSLAKMLHTHKKSRILSMEESSVEAIENVALKYFEFGEEVYTERVKQLEEVARRSGLQSKLGPIPNYEERMAWYREKCVLESQSGKATIEECTINSEEEQLQLKCIGEMPIKITAKEYNFVGGGSGDLLFMVAHKTIFVVEVKCSSNSGTKYRKVKEQAKKYADVFHVLHPTATVYGLAYTYQGFSEIVKYGTLSEDDPLLNLKFPFTL